MFKEKRFSTSVWNENDSMSFWFLKLKLVIRDNLNRVERCTLMSTITKKKRFGENDFLKLFNFDNILPSSL